jgi:hypothetical protein
MAPQWSWMRDRTAEGDEVMNLFGYTGVGTLALAAKGAGKTVAEAKAAILADPAVLQVRATLTGGDSAKEGAFAVYLVDWFVKRVYAEADGPLDDSIPNTF